MISFQLFSTSLSFAVPLILAALGGLVQMRSGIVNIALEGQMLIGALVGLVTASWLSSWLLGSLLAVVAVVLSGLFITVLMNVFKANQIIVGLGFNILALGIIGYILKSVLGVSGTLQVDDPAPLPVLNPISSEDGFLASLLNDRNPVFWFTVLLVIALPIVLRKTPLGTHIRAVGFSYEGAESLGLRARRLQLGSGAFAGAMAALGGAELSMGQVGLFNVNMISGRGYVALAAIYFGAMIVIPTTIACVLFAFFEALQIRLQLNNIPASIVSTLPYVMVVLGLFSSRLFSTIRRKNVISRT